MAKTVVAVLSNLLESFGARARIGARGEGAATNRQPTLPPAAHDRNAAIALSTMHGLLVDDFTCEEDRGTWG